MILVRIVDASDVTFRAAGLFSHRLCLLSRGALRTSRRGRSEDARARERLASGAADLELVRAACDAEDSCDADFAAAKTIAQEAAVSSRYVYLDEPVRVSLQEGPVPGMATHFALQITVKAYVFDSRFETAFGTDVTERVKRAFKAGGIHTVGERDSPAMRSEDL